VANTALPAVSAKAADRARPMEAFIRLAV